MRTTIERIGVSASLALLFAGGYFGVGRATDPARAVELGSRLDRAIPFAASTIWIYLWIFPAALIPIFVVRCRRLFLRTALAYATVMVVSFLCFWAFPVTSERLRAAPALLDVARPSGWAVSVVYALDSPANLFPSLHLSIVTVAAFAAWKAARVYGVMAFVGVSLVAVSVCTVKQHFVCDALGGLALAAFASALFIGPYRPNRELPLAYSWSGPALHLGVTVLTYTGYLVAFVVR